jgi:hypothetical protein
MSGSATPSRSRWFRCRHARQRRPSMATRQNGKLRWHDRICNLRVMRRSEGVSGGPFARYLRKISLVRCGWLRSTWNHIGTTSGVAEASACEHRGVEIVASHRDTAPIEVAAPPSSTQSSSKSDAVVAGCVDQSDDGARPTKARPIRAPPANFSLGLKPSSGCSRWWNSGEVSASTATVSATDQPPVSW